VPFRQNLYDVQKYTSNREFRHKILNDNDKRMYFPPIDLGQAEYSFDKKDLGVSMADVTYNKTRKNLGTIERVLTAVGGVALAFYGLKKRSTKGWLSAAAGGGLIACGVTGHSLVMDAFGINHGEKTQNPIVSVPHGEGIKVEQTIAINRSPNQLYRFWRNFENLPLVMKHLESVTVTDDQHSHWIAKAPAGQVVEWDAVIHNEIPGRLIAWRSVDGSEVDHAGSVEFKENPNGGTDLKVVINYRPPAGKLGAVVATILGESPSQQIDEDLQQFKNLIEATEISSLDRSHSPNA
jgi:uncharacterized membrane protein